MMQQATLEHVEQLAVQRFFMMQLKRRSLSSSTCRIINNSDSFQDDH